MSLPAGTQIGKYIVHRKLAEGGMAEIYLATVQGPEGFQKEVVIKRVRPLLAEDETFVRMFVDEARLASRLSHANLVQIFDFDKHEDTYYLAMEYVRGQSLWSLRRRAKERMHPMSPVLVAQVGLELARGLHYAHRLTDRGELLGLVHRDVTPHNVLLSYEGAIKLTDFGIAKAGNRLTSAGMLKGKFAYMSPEQARGENVDARTDVFALGIVLWELLTGSRLFEDDSDIGVLRAVQERAIPPPARLNVEVPAPLDAAVMKALDRDLNARFASAQELERALAQFLLGAARNIEDTDVGAYLRDLFPDEALHSEDHAATAMPVPTMVLKPMVAAPASGAAVSGRVLSPDEDPYHSTLVLPPPAPKEVPVPPKLRRSGWAGALVAALMVAGAGTVWLVRHPSLLSRWIEVATVASGTEPARRAGLGNGAATDLAAAPGGGSAGGHDLAAVPAGGDAAGHLTAASGGAGAMAARAGQGSSVPSASATTSGEAETDAAADAVASAKAETELPAGAFGTLTLRVKPWANVQIDGHPRKDVQGTRIVRLSAGDHTVKLIHQSQTETFKVAIRARKNTPIDFSFK